MKKNIKKVGVTEKIVTTYIKTGKGFTKNGLANLVYVASCIILFVSPSLLIFHLKSYILYMDTCDFWQIIVLI